MDMDRLTYLFRSVANDDENEYSTCSINQVKYFNVPLTKPLYSITWIRKGNVKTFLVESRTIVSYFSFDAILWMYYCLPRRLETRHWVDFVFSSSLIFVSSCFLMDVSVLLGWTVLGCTPSVLVLKTRKKCYFNSWL